MSNAQQIPGDEPTGEIAYPFVLMEGDESAGKTTGALALARHPRINNAWALELGESKLDQYKRIAPYRVLRHNGTYTEIRDQFRTAIKYSRANPAQDGKVDLIIFDGGTSLWDLEKRRVDERAFRAAKKKAERNNWNFDPDAPIDRSFNLWADAKERWYGIINLLREWEGIVVITARGKETMVIGDGGAPVAGQIDWKVQTEGSLKFEVDAWVRMIRPHRATLIGCKALDVDVPEEGIAIPDGNIKDRGWCGPLAPVIFDMIGAGADKFSKSTHVYGSVGHTAKEGKDFVLERFMRTCGGDEACAKAIAGEVWRAAGLTPFTGDAEINDEAWTKLCTIVADKVTELMQPAEPSEPEAPGVQNVVPMNAAPPVDNLQPRALLREKFEELTLTGDQVKDDQHDRRFRKWWIESNLPQRDESIVSWFDALDALDANQVDAALKAIDDIWAKRQPTPLKADGNHPDDDPGGGEANVKPLADRVVDKPTLGSQTATPMGQGGTAVVSAHPPAPQRLGDPMKLLTVVRREQGITITDQWKFASELFNRPIHKSENLIPAELWQLFDYMDSEEFCERIAKQAEAVQAVTNAFGPDVEEAS